VSCPLHGAHTSHIDLTLLIVDRIPSSAGSEYAYMLYEGAALASSGKRNLYFRHEPPRDPWCGVSVGSARANGLATLPDLRHLRSHLLGMLHAHPRMRAVYRWSYWRLLHPVLAEARLFRECRGDLRKWRTIRLALPYTMVGWRRLSNAYDLAAAVDMSDIPGAIVECGVLNGGCAAVMAAASAGRPIWLFDSFQGLPFPTEHDGSAAFDYAQTDRGTGELAPIHRCVGDIDKVREIFSRLRIAPSRVFLEKGWFQDTLPSAKERIGSIALLRLDADWYESTKVCLDLLYDNLAPGGYLIIDDFGYWEGCRKATLEFLARMAVHMPLHRIDETGVYLKKGSG
jgi:O-methyltransferase